MAEARVAAQQANELRAGCGVVEQEAAAAREGGPGAQPSSFRKGMDPQEARLLRLARNSILTNPSNDGRLTITASK